jgi:peptide deformylase
MAIRTILQLGDPRLRVVARPVSDPTAPRIASLIADLSDTLADSKATIGYGRGIAAPQIGIESRVIFLQLRDDSPWPMVNPEITECSHEKVVVWDCCLSFPSIFMQVERCRNIKVRYQTPQGDYRELRAGDDRNLSELLQHEIDHLDGVLAIDRMTDLKTLCTRDEFERRYKAASPYA